MAAAACSGRDFAVTLLAPPSSGRNQETPEAPGLSAITKPAWSTIAEFNADVLESGLAQPMEDPTEGALHAAALSEGFFHTPPDPHIPGISPHDGPSSFFTSANNQAPTGLDALGGLDFPPSYALSPRRSDAAAAVVGPAGAAAAVAAGGVGSLGPMTAAMLRLRRQRDMVNISARPPADDAQHGHAIVPVLVGTTAQHRPAGVEYREAALHRHTQDLMLRLNQAAGLDLLGDDPPPHHHPPTRTMAMISGGPLGVSEAPSAPPAPPGLFGLQGYQPDTPSPLLSRTLYEMVSEPRVSGEPPGAPSPRLVRIDGEAGLRNAGLAGFVTSTFTVPLTSESFTFASPPPPIATSHPLSTLTEDYFGSKLVDEERYSESDGSGGGSIVFRDSLGGAIAKRLSSWGSLMDR